MACQSLWRTFSKPIEEMSKQDACLKCFYTSARKKDGTFYKSSSTKSIRAATDLFLRLPPPKPFSIITDPAFTEANKVLHAFVKDLRKTGKIAGVVHKRAISKEQLKKLFESGELGPPGSLNPAQLQRTAWFYLGLFFRRRGRENHRQLTTAMLSLRKTPQGVEYYLAGYKKSPGRPRRCWRWIGCEDFFRPGIWKISSKNAQELPEPSQSNVRCFVSEIKRWSKKEVQSRRRQNLSL